MSILDIPHYKHAIAAREAEDDPPRLTLVHNADIETAALEADTARLTGEVRSLTVQIRLSRQDLSAMLNLRANKAAALETSMRALAARVKR